MITDAIRDRRSCRTFDPRPLPPDTAAAVERLIRKPLRGPFGGVVRFALVPVHPGPGDRRRRMGTYGFVQGAPAFLAGAVTRGPRSLEDYGWCMEKVVLDLTAMGLGTCWLGGTFRRSSFARAVELAPGEVQPAVSPVGFPTVRKGPVDIVASTVAGSRGRRRWEDLFLFDKAGAGPWMDCLEAVRLAPSAANGQPWRMVQAAAPAVFHFYSVRSAGRSLQAVDMGIAMCHFELVARELGLGGSWKELADPGDRPGLAYTVSWLAPGA